MGKIKEKHSRKGGWLYLVFAAVVIFLLWGICAVVLDVNFLPTPWAVVKHVVEIFPTLLYGHVLMSLLRIGEGLGIALVLGAAIGLTMGYSAKVDKVLSPFVYLIYPVPKIALLPLVMLICGMGEISKITMIVLIVIFQIIVAARDGAKNIPKENYYCLEVLGASKITCFRKIVIPGTMPGIFSSLRVSLGTAISVLFFTETYGTKLGMGYFVMNSWTRINYLDMFAGILVLAIVGFCLFLVIDKVNALVCKWTFLEK